MKSATHMLVTMEIERSPEPIRDQQTYRRKRLPEVYEQHLDAWRKAYTANPSITIDELVELVTGYRPDALRSARTKMERNMAQVRELARTQPIDPEVNARGFARARAVLRGVDDGR
jgi:hypothetical protein